VKIRKRTFAWQDFPATFSLKQCLNQSMISLQKQTVSELSKRASLKFKNRTAFEFYHDECTYNRVTYREFGKMTRQFASLLVSLGVQPADRVMIIAENRLEWAIAYFGVTQAGAA
jgi:long-chain acyl-CoA synthetase